MTHDRGGRGRGGRQPKEERITPRNRRLDQALQTPKRGIWIATVVILLVGLVAVIWVVSPTEQRRRGVMEALQLGDSTTRVVGYLGQPPARCPGTRIRHLAESFPQGWPAASIQTALQELGEQTGERWVYPINPRRRAGCAPRDGQTEIGVGRNGRVLWYVAVTGKTPLRLPEEFSPADPEGS